MAGLKEEENSHLPLRNVQRVEAFDRNPNKPEGSGSSSFPESINNDPNSEGSQSLAIPKNDSNGIASSYADV